jgi:hypothetical protein
MLDPRGRTLGWILISDVASQAAVEAVSSGKILACHAFL